MSDSCLVIYNMILIIDKLLHIISIERGNEVFATSFDRSYSIKRGNEVFELPI
jgi:hypothetical protein